MRGFGIGVILLLAVALFSGSASADDRKNRPKVDPKPGPGGGGKVWRLPGSGGGALPSVEEFDYAGNGLFIDPDCQYAIEGNRFWPSAEFGLNAIEAPSLAQTLSIPDNSVVGFIDYLINVEGFQQPYDVAGRILAEAAPMCASLPDDQWGDGLFAWYGSLVERITRYMEETIDFGGEG